MSSPDLLRLKQEHVKFWRPQILLFINDPRHQYKLIQFCNSLKKGALFILGHVIVTEDFGGAVPEARRQHAAWTKYIDFSKIKAFVNIAISPGLEWGSRNIVLSAGLGGMRPNIVVMGFYNLDQLRKDQPLIEVPSPPLSRPSSLNGAHSRPGLKKRKRDSKTDKTSGLLPTDTNRVESAVGVTSYLTVLEDMILRLQINVAIAKGFQGLEFPDPNGDNTKKYIDLWPIQMSAEIASEGGEHKQNVLTTNFDTYTLILQLGCILNTVPKWKKAYRLRVIVFVEYETDVEEERGRVISLLENLRIEANVLVFWLASGDVKSYQVVVNGEGPNVDKEAEKEVDSVLKDEDWWQDLRRIRGKAGQITPSQELAHMEGLLKAAPTWPSSSFQHGRKSEGMARFEGLKKFIRHSKKRSSMSNLSTLGVSLGMRTHRLEERVVQNHASHQSASEASDSSEESDSDSIASYSEDEMAASEADVDDFSSEASDDSRPKSAVKRVSRRRSHGDSLQSPKKISQKHSSKTAAEPRIPIIKTTAAASEPALVDVSNSIRPSPLADADQASAIESSESESVEGLMLRPHATRHSSAPKFSSSPVPVTKVATDDSPGPSIMFTAPTLGTPPRDKDKSIYSRQPPSPPKEPELPKPTPASGYPLQQSIPLSFNDVPCRAQHLILNELMQSQSAETAVIFTTLPPPLEGTHRSQKDSVSYLSDLEVLCQSLPPVLLVHSNSMTVTMAL
jgi:solute carrier family 12 (potassium/chloride transporters), member 9